MALEYVLSRAADLVVNIVDATNIERNLYLTLQTGVLNRVLGIPFFLLVMYAVFWVTLTIGGAFIDFFDIAGGTVFVDGTRVLLGNENGWC